MLDAIKNLFKKKEKAPLAGAAENKYYIDKYKDFDKVIKTYY